MSLNFHEIRTGQQQQCNFTIDQLIEGLGADPHGLECSEKLKQNAHEILRDALRLLVPELDQLEKTNEPAQLKLKMAESIEVNLIKLESHDLKEIASAIGLDPTRYDNTEKLIKALSSQIRDGLYKPADLATALDILGAGRLIEKLAPKEASNLSHRLKELLNFCAEALKLLISLAGNPDRTPFPTTKPVDLASLSSILSNIFALNRNKSTVILEKDDERVEKKPNSIFQILAASCEEFGNSLAKEKRIELVQDQNQQELSLEFKKDAAAEFLSANAELAQYLSGMVNDLKFTDGPISASKRLAALAFAKNKKQELD